MGQAAGTAAAMASAAETTPADVATASAQQFRQQLLRDGCYLPNSRNEDPADVALQARASASTQRTFNGLGRNGKVEDPNLRERVWTSGNGHSKSLAQSPCQWFPMAGGVLNALSLDLRNNGDQPAAIDVTLRMVDTLWDYEVATGKVVWQDKATVPVGWDGMLELSTSLSNLADGCYRIELSGPADVDWICSSNRAHAVAGGHIIGSGRYHWNRLHGEFAFQLSPPQPVFPPEQALSGITRPTASTNMWLSCAAASMPQWFCLEWQQPVAISTIELTFPSQLVLETHWENPFYTAPHIPAAYQLQVPDANATCGWRTIVRVTDNYQARCRHQLTTPINTAQLRLVIDSTHGSPSAGLTEIRCYG
jgi:hypothetical protein